MKGHDIIECPRVLGATCAIGAVALGVIYMAFAGAPMRYPAINAGALVIGLTMLALLGRSTIAGGWASAAMAGALVATALLGDAVEGAARWVHVGGLAVQPSLVLLPVMLVAFARVRRAASTAAMIATAAALALQPDRAAAGMLVLGLAVLTILRPDRHVVAALIAGVAGFALTLVQADTLPAVPYVDQILYSSFDVHVAVGLAVLAGSALLLVPAIVGCARDPGDRATYAVFGTVWFVAILAAALGNYPTPIVGYGGSAILGYVLSLLALPKVAGVRTRPAPQPRRAPNRTPPDRDLSISLA